MRWSICVWMVCALFSCTKQQTDVSSSNTTTTFPKQVPGPFGVMAEGITDNYKIIACKALGVTYVRNEVVMEDAGSDVPYMDSLLNNHFTLVTNFNYYNSSKGAMPFMTDASKITNDINLILQKFHPALVAVENEETNKKYHTGSAQDYIKELTAATQALHQQNIKVTNGGLVEDLVCLLTWKDYISRGMTTEANSFAQRCIPVSISNDLPDLNNHSDLKERMQFADTLIQAYKNADLDYINFHWYEPVLNRWNATSQSSTVPTGVDTKAMQEVMAFLNRATGKTVITNETGELYNSPGIVKDMLQEFVTQGTPYVIWYSGDGHNQDGAVALNNADGSLRSNGKAFLQFLQNLYD